MIADIQGRHPSSPIDGMEFATEHKKQNEFVLLVVAPAPKRMRVKCQQPVANRNCTYIVQSTHQHRSTGGDGTRNRELVLLHSTSLFLHIFGNIVSPQMHLLDGISLSPFNSSPLSFQLTLRVVHVKVFSQLKQYAIVLL